MVESEKNQCDVYGLWINNNKKYNQININDIFLDLRHLHAHGNERTHCRRSIQLGQPDQLIDDRSIICRPLREIYKSLHKSMSCEASIIFSLHSADFSIINFSITSRL